MTSRAPLPLAPPSPVWIVRTPPRTDDVEIVFVGVANREELDRHVERLARWPWTWISDDEGPHGVTVLADVRGEAIGVRLEGLASQRAGGEASIVREVLADLFDPLLVAHAIRSDVARRLLSTDTKGPL